MSDKSGRLSLGPAPARKSSFNAGRATIAAGYDETLVGDPFDISGYLQKRGEKWSTAWRRRWFEIKEGKLYYYKSHVPGTAPQGTIPLEDISQVYACEDKKCEGFAFELATQKRIYYLAAESPADRRRWVDSLTLVRRLVKADRMGIPRENVAPLGRPTVVGMPPYAQQGTAGDAATAQSTRATGPTAARTAQDEEYQFSEEPVHTDRRSTQDSEDRDSTTPSASPPKEEPVKKQEHRSDASSAASKDQKDASSGRGNGAGTGAAVAVAAGAAVVAGGAAVAVAGSANEDKKADSGKSNGPATQAAEKSGDPATDPNAIVAPPPREPPPMNDVLRQILTEVDDTIIPQGVGSDLVGRILMEDATRPYTRSPSTSSAGINSPSATPHTPAAPAQTLAAPVASEARAAPSGLSDKAATGKTAPTTTPTTATTDKTDSSTTNNARHHDQSNDVKAAGRQSRSGTKDGSSGGNAAVAAGAVAVGAAAVAAAVVAGSKSDSGHSKDTSAQDQRAQQSQPTSTATAQASTTGDGKGQEPPTLVKSTTSTSSQDDVAASQPQSVPKSEPAATTATSSSTASPATGSAVAAAATGSTEGYTSHRDSVTSQGSVHDQPARRRYQSFTHPDESDDDDGDAGKGKSGTASGRGSVYDNNTTTTPTPAGAGDDDDDDDGHAAIPAGIAGLTGATSGAGASDGTTTTGNVIDSVAVYHEPAPAKPKPMFHAHFRDLPPLSPHTLLRHLLEVNDAIEAWVRENIDKLMAMTEEGMKPPLLPKNLGDQIRPAAPPAPQEKAAPISIEPQPGMPVTTAGSTPTQVSTSPNDDGTSFLARKKAAILQKLKKKNSQQDVTQGGGGGGAQGPSDGDPFGSVESEAGSTGSSATPSGSAPAHDHKAHVVAYGGMPMQQHRRFDISGAPELAHSLVSVVASILMNGLKTEGIFGRITLWQCIRKFPNPAVEALLNYVEGFVWEGIPDVFLKYMRAALFIQIGLNQGWLFTHFARLCNNNPNFFDWYDPSAILRNPGNRTLFFNCLEQIQQKFLVTSELDTNMTLMYMPRTSLPATLRLGEAVGSKCLWSHGLLEASLNADLIERLESVVNSVGRLSSDVQAASALVTIQSATEDKEALDKMEFKLSVMVRRELADVLAEILLDGFKHFKIFGSYSLWDIFEFQAGQDKFASANLDVLRFTRSISAINATVQNVPDMNATQKADMKFRSVICAGLNNQHLHVWIQWLVNNLELNAKFFEPWAMFRNPLVHERILILLEVLSNIQFRLPLDFELRARRQAGAK